MKLLADCLLYAFVDSAYLDGRDPEVLCRQLCDGGADLVQLRAKDWPVEEVTLPVFIDDRAFVAPALLDATDQFPSCASSRA